jgi:magnesium transporter
MDTLGATGGGAAREEQRGLLAELSARAPADAAALLAVRPAPVIANALTALNPALVIDIMHALPGPVVEAVVGNVPAALAQQWQRNRSYDPGQVGRYMEPPLGVMAPELTVAAAVAQLRDLVQRSFITYVYVVDGARRLLGVVTMRDLLFSPREATLEAVMLRNVYTLHPGTDVSEAMKGMVGRHYPVYPVCDREGVLVGLVRGQALFEAHAVDITAQPGTMVGVEKEERLATPWLRSLRFRHPWLQLNLATAFAAGGVVALFQDTVDRLVILALFLSVLAGQSGNTGCQALAVTLRGMTLGDLRTGREKLLVLKEAALGLMNGASTGFVAALGMYVVASLQHHAHALLLALVVWVALIGSCVASGICGALVPLTLKRLGADPATASSIFLTTATDVVSMGLLLGLAAWLIP